MDLTPYYNTADEVAQRISSGEFDRAILVCGTGMGMSIVANKHSGIYAAVCENTFAAEK
ncbi:RpiB/LacA/LacB family sugar-phosphate isomerase [Candidatus Thiosymbion oneisti]|uniref:RpiB/LacA/LacB family sugar-phosphate isomerase n=1 Tax=Candidatus Thiosymbion oneisti TaxID=589554 RepID=UPI000AE2AE50|nr:RpiB/LacA/LacB family sugar-phosphate isomerase [Candidatus Thiosymbion oneisti]